MRIYGDSATAKSDRERMQGKGWDFRCHFFQDSTVKWVFVYRMSAWGDAPDMTWKCNHREVQQVRGRFRFQVTG
jgi:hypothetical protein